MGHSNPVKSIAGSVKSTVKGTADTLANPFDNPKKTALTAASLYTMGAMGSVGTQAAGASAGAQAIGATALNAASSIPTALPIEGGVDAMPTTVEHEVDPAAIIALRRQRLLSAYGRQSTILTDPAGGSNSLGAASGKTSLGL